MNAFQKVIASYAADPDRVNASIEEFHVIVVIVTPLSPSGIGFDMIGPLPAHEIQGVKDRVHAILAEIAKDAAYDVGSFRGRPKGDMIVNPSLENWEQSARKRATIR